MTEREAFGLELRRARERRGLTLEEVSERTKVSIAHFSGLERGDLSHWPAGIFRRAFVRGYASAVGLDPEALVAEFGRIFPDPGDPQRAAVKTPRPSKPQERLTKEPEPSVQAAPSDEVVGLSPLRLVLDAPSGAASGDRLAALARRLAAGAIDILLPLAAAGAVALAAGRGWFWITAALAALGGHIVFFGLTGSTPGGWLLALPRQPAPGRTLPSPSRRRGETDAAAGGRRHVPRLPASRPASHQHRVRH